MKNNIHTASVSDEIDTYNDCSKGKYIIVKELIIITLTDAVKVTKLRVITLMNGIDIDVR